MTRYEQGFMRKCAEYGVDYGRARRMLKQADGIDGALDLLNQVNNERMVLRNTRWLRAAPAIAGTTAAIGIPLALALQKRRQRRSQR